ncbi:hypothetical protein AK812_SmicGene25254 [Symbiodinium microadriaticum]|uniref:Uncharacterized protein n=1 Tax=Symbiodinium microadriaticum TaxID=2951 RepID=A0A1Q9DCM3_SYMMI|nr:hypothetical protein AK812_SmicGene25254 [Symbiodinium microadriaticum]
MELLAPAVREDNLPDLELIDLSVEHRLLRLGVSALFLQLCLETAVERQRYPPAAGRSSAFGAGFLADVRGLFLHR